MRVLWGDGVGIKVFFLLSIGLLMVMALLGSGVVVFPMASYLPVHTLMETFSVMVAVLIFAVGWSGFTADRAKSIVVLSCALLCVGLIDMVHFLSYPGMPDFVTPNSGQKSIFFWLCARGILAATLLQTALTRWRPFDNGNSRYFLLVGALALTASCIWIGLYRLQWVPTLYVDETGLTRTKVLVELGIAGTYAVAGAVFFTRSKRDERQWMRDLALCCSIMVVSEIYFALFKFHSDVLNAIGHIYKVIAYVFLYRAVFLHSVRLPIEQLKASDTALRISEKVLRRTQIAVDRSSDFIFMFDERGRFIYTNARAGSRLGYTQQELLSMRIADIDKNYQAVSWNALWAEMQRVGSAILETNHTAKNGETFPVEISVTLIEEDQHVFGCAIVRDISERLQAESRIQYLAHHDALTGLPNRAQLEERAQYSISLAHRNKQSLALMFLDLDHFKDINDTLGHSVGDLLLIELARRLRAELRAEDTVARLGGDEFIILLSGVDAHSVARAAQKVLDIIAEPYRIDAYDLSVTGSIGIALYPDDSDDLENLLKSADSAMYHAKQDGRQCYRYFTQEMQVRSARNLQLVNALRQALERNQLQIHYQPQVSIHDQRIVGAEALLRWTHPELGAVSPAEFIPAAEESGLILAIGEWVLRHAVRQAKCWMQQGFPPLVMAVNLSAVQFRHPDLPNLVTKILNEEDLPPEYLELELTEGVAMHDPQGAIAMMTNLHDRGVRMSIDDFGTGYSSLSHLKKFKVYKLKIDQSFVRDISTDSEDRAIVGAIIQLANSLGLQTIAEGVETAGQLAFLREEGCDEMQGYYFSKPLPADQFEAFVRSKNHSVFVSGIVGA